KLTQMEFLKAEESRKISKEEEKERRFKRFKEKE
ncbi:hypothetical protein RF55_17660, partial [Lasius niger]